MDSVDAKPQNAPAGALLSETQAPPVMEARRWLEDAVFPADRPLLNLSQAAPADPPPENLRQVMAEAVLSGGQAHFYGPVLGDPALRAEIAARWSPAYGGVIAEEDVAITAGCNQAFCAAISTFASPGDAVLIPTPWYFNHKMWLDMAGVRAAPLPCDLSHNGGALPSVETARALATPQTKA
ncbi:MAG: aminotransferase class I/II-fold pyridoxal phosphate-dependent enzyme, partial [Rhodobacteraceae bacterium]|nr:aminotransferase class I/II-fold pyridoxal phosphate-dependent enzyme [Paracoccaceae bacterium]